MPAGQARETLRLQLQSPLAQLPSYWSLQHARVKLDLLNILYERKLANEWCYLRYIMVDSSPQCGRDYLCCIEERIRLPKGNFSSQYWCNFDLNSGFEKREMQLSTLAGGHATHVKKSLNFINIVRMESGALPVFDDKRAEIKCITTDQGT